MSGHWITTQLEGVLARTSAPIVDERGSFTELWRASWTEGLDDRPFAQANLSRSRAGVLRGMHFHLHQADLWIVVSGKVLTATTDLRAIARSSNESVHSQVIELSSGDALFIPRLVAHGFWAHEDTALMYLVSNEFDGTDERGFKWDDAAAAIDWPPGEPIVSERDRQNPPFRDVVSWIQKEVSK